MIIYNVTLTVEDEIHDDWLNWMKTVHIPDVMKTQCFESYKICRVIKNSQEGQSYAIQYSTKNMATLHKYQVHFAANLQKDHTERYQDKVLAFRTLLEVIG